MFSTALVFLCILVDMSDVHVNVQAVRIHSLKLLGIINNVRPHLQKHLNAAADVDVIEYVKGKMVEGEQLGITSKFSAPGKYRRNMRQLKKADATLDSVESEVREIYKSLEMSQDAMSNDVSNVDTRLSLIPQDNESDIVPVTKTSGTRAGDNSTEDIFAKLHQLDDDNSNEQTKLPTKVALLFNNSNNNMERHTFYANDNLLTYNNASHFTKNIYQNKT